MDNAKRSILATPEAVLALFILTSNLIWTLQCSLLQSVLSIDIYETIVWGSQLQWGHSKHPPLSGWIGYFASWVTGHSDWGMYLIAQLCIGAGVFFSFKLARLFFDRYRAAMAALMLYLLIFYTPSEMKFSTYFVEIAIAPAAAYALLNALREGKIWRWLILGALCALGILNKYSFGLIMAGFALIVLTRREYRKSLLTAGPYLAVLVFALVIAPHLKWLWEHDFVCFKHVGGRLDEEHSPFMPLLVAAVTLYPVAAEFLALAVAAFPSREQLHGQRGGYFARVAAGYREIFSHAKTPSDREALHFSALLTLLPGAVYLVLSFCGTDIILMWMCSVFSASGIMVLAIFPLEIDRRIFRRFAVLLSIYIALVFAVTTVDALCRTTISMHLDPADVVRQSDALWRKHTAEPVRVVVGGLRYAALYSHYSAGHPPVCEPDDEIMIDLYRERIRRHGALLIDSSEDDFVDFLKRAGAEVRFVRCRVGCRSLLGRRREKTVCIGYLPPGSGI